MPQSGVAGTGSPPVRPSRPPFLPLDSDHRYAEWQRCCRWGWHPSHVFIHFSSRFLRRWASTLPSCLWSLRIFPSLPGSRLTFFRSDASSALLQLVNQWLNSTYSRSHAFRYVRQNKNPAFDRIELTTSALAGVQVTYYIDHSGDDGSKQ